MQIGILVNKMLMLFLLMLAGYLANKLRVIKTEMNQPLTKLVINITLPCTIIAVSFSSLELNGKTTLIFIALSVLATVVGFIAGALLAHLMRAPKRDRGIYSFAVTFGNVGFMGYPLSQAIFGDVGLLYAALFNVSFNVLVYSLGAWMISGGKGGKFSLKSIINAPLIATVLSLILMAVKITLPEFLTESVSMLGNVTTPLAMIIIGSSLAAVPIKEVFNEWRVYVMSVVKLIIMPVVMWLICRIFVTDATALGVMVLMIAMPCASVMTMLCIEHGLDDRLSAKCTFITTLLSLVTVPIIMYVLL